MSGRHWRPRPTRWPQVGSTPAPSGAHAEVEDATALAYAWKTVPVPDHVRRLRYAGQVVGPISGDLITLLQAGEPYEYEVPLVGEVSDICYRETLARDTAGMLRRWWARLREGVT